MRTTTLLLTILITLTLTTASAATEGKITGGIIYTLPGWFKQSLLDFPEDVADAREQEKHVMVFLHLDECPYCARTVEENFRGGEITDFVQKNFDVVAINIRGSLEVTWIDGESYSERALSRQVKVYATPTIIFLDQQGEKALQLTGYRDPVALRHAMEYVRSKSYLQQKFADYLKGIERPAQYALRPHAQFDNATYFKDYNKPLALLFEDKHCTECARFHDTTLNHPEVAEAMKQFLFVRFDTDSPQTVIDLAGKRTTPAAWAESLGLTYRPSVVLFNEGREIFRADGRLYHQHFLESLNYVGGGHYREFDQIRDYKAQFRAARIKSGLNVDYSE